MNHIRHIHNRSYGIINATGRVLRTELRAAHAYENCRFPRDDVCETCHGGRRKVQKKKTLWERIFSKRRDLPETNRLKRPPRESCQLLAGNEPEFEEIPMFIEKMKCEHQNATIKRQGRGYLMEIYNKFGEEKKKSKEDEILDRIESVKEQEIEDVCNPMPQFTTVGQRWIDLQLRGLHPLYKKYENTKHRCKRYDCIEEQYKFVPADISCDEYPDKLKFGGPGEKVTFSDFKEPDIPRRLVGKMTEMKINMKSDLEYKLTRQRPTCDKNRYNRAQGRIVTLN